MLSSVPKFPFVAFLTVYFLVITVLCLRKLHGVSLWRRICSLLFPASQLCLVLFALWCAAAYAAPPAPAIVLGVLAVACGPVDLLLFRALRDACFRAQAAEQVRELEDALAVQQLLRQRSAHEREEADRMRQRVLEQISAAEADLKAQHAAQASESLDRVIDAIGGAQARFCAHPAIDALIRLKAADARTAGIRMDVKLNAPLDLALPSAEVCAVFSNLVDNALAACAAVPQPERFVSVAARMLGRYFVVDVENSCADAAVSGAADVPCKGDARGEAGSETRSADESVRANRRVKRLRAASVALAPAPPATPDVSSPHGWGRGIIENIAGRHDGRVAVEREQGRYHVRVILRMDGGDAQ